MKKAYETPKVQEIGSVHELTLGSNDGDVTDATFPVNTPKKDLTFS